MMKIRTMKAFAALSLLCGLSLPAFCQAVRVDPLPVFTTSGSAPFGSYAPVLAVPNATIQLCLNSTCTSIATSYTDVSGTTSCPMTAQVVQSGSLFCTSTAGTQGQFGFWLLPGTYWYRVTLPSGSRYGTFPITAASSSSMVAAAPPSGSVQFNCGGSFCGSANFTYNDTTKALVITGNTTGGFDGPVFSSTNTGTNSAVTQASGTFKITGGGDAFFQSLTATQAFTGTSVTLSSSIFLDQPVSNRNIDFLTSASLRWVLRADNAPESGSNAGTNFDFRRYLDDGTTVDTVLTLTRSTGNAELFHNLTVDGNQSNGGSIDLASSLILDQPAGSSRNIDFDSSASLRWIIRANNVPESGANSGSNFDIRRYLDDGTTVDTPFSILRSTGDVTILHNLTISGSCSGCTASAPGSNTQLLFNNMSVIAAATGLTWNSGSTLFAVTGNQTNSGTIDLASSLILDQAAGTNRNIDFQSASVLRWIVRANNVPESGSNSGSNFDIRRYLDDGTTVDTPFTILRSTGDVTIAHNLTISGTCTGCGATVPGSNTQLIFNSSGVLAATSGMTWNGASLTATSLVASAGLTVTSNGFNVTGASTISAAGGSASFHTTSTAFAFAADFTDTGGTCRIGFASGGITCPSDSRLKENIVSLGDELDKVMQLRPVSFDWKSNGAHADGLIAQEVMTVFPGAVHMAEDGYWNLSPQQLIPYLIKAIQEMQGEIVALKGAVRQ